MQRLASRIAFATALGVMSTTAMAAIPTTAQSFSYNYVEAGVRFPDYDRADAIGLGALMSYQLTPDPRLRFMGSFTYDDLSNPDGNVTNLLLDVGYAHPVNAQLDIVGDVGLVFNNTDIGNFSDDDTGLRVAGYARYQVDPKVEVQAGLNYLDIYDDGELGVNLGAYLKIDQKLSAMLRYDDEGDVDTLTVGARVNF